MLFRYSQCYFASIFYSTAYSYDQFLFSFLHFNLCRMCVCHMFNKVLTYLLNRHSNMHHHCHSPSITPSLFTPGWKLIFSTNPYLPVLLPFHPPDWLYGLQLFFVFLGHVDFDFGMSKRFTVKSYWHIYTPIYTPINLEQNNIKIINLSWSTSLQCFLKRSMRACVRYQRFPSPRPGTHCRWMSSHPLHFRSSVSVWRHSSSTNHFLMLYDRQTKLSWT